MKTKAIFSAFILLTTFCSAQTDSAISPMLKTIDSQIGIGSGNINSFNIPYWKTTHIVSPEPILYVDISTPNVEGDLPEKNIFRLKPVVLEGRKDGLTNGENFTVTIVTQTFITVYKLSFIRKEQESDSTANTAFVLLIDPTKAIQLNSYRKITDGDFDLLSIRAMANKRSVFKVEASQSGMSFWLNNVYVIGNLMLFDMGAKNHTKLPYDLNGLNFKLADKYAINATVSQEIEIKPLYSYTDDASTIIDRKWRNFYILKKFTFPAQKVLKIQMTENQISGRPITVVVGYDKILNSKSLIGDKD